MARELDQEHDGIIRTRSVWDDRTGLFKLVTTIIVTGYVRDPNSAIPAQKTGGYVSAELPYDGTQTLDQLKAAMQAALKAQGGVP